MRSVSADFLADMSSFPPQYLRREFTVSAGRFQINLGRHTRVMGILNITPDSFSHDGCWRGNSRETVAKALRRARRMAADGADLLDAGGASSRPGARQIPAKEERRRVIPVIQKLVKELSIPISVDTYKPEVAQAAMDAGAVIVNTILGANPSRALLKMIQRYDAAVVLMHMRGTPRTMQRNPQYSNVIVEIISALRKSARICLDSGIKSDKIIIDPGIGFGKSVDHNLQIIRRLDEFKALNCPLLIGTSRKSFIGKVLNREAAHRLIGTVAATCAAVWQGAQIVRVHDVKEIKEAVTMVDAVRNSFVAA